MDMHKTARLGESWRVWLVHHYLQLRRIIQKPPPPIDFQQTISATRRVLVVLPDDESLCSILPTVSAALKELFRAERQDCAVPDHRRDLVADGNCLEYSLQQRNFLGLPDAQLSIFRMLLDNGYFYRG